VTQDDAHDGQELRSAVRSIVAEELEVEPDELTETATFEEEYDADSLSLLAIAARFERELGIAIPSDRVGEMTSLDMVVKMVDEHRGTGSHV
jgi:acyl carrier protein